MLDAARVQCTNTLTGVKQSMHPLIDNHILLYVCGITPYDFAHVGHARVYIFFDVVCRFLIFLGYKVTYCRNFTDIDDKLIERAQKIYNDVHLYPKIAQEFINAFTEDMDALGCLKPTYEPRVTDHIPQIIEFIEGLIACGAAYEVGGSVYFEVSTYQQYGKLSKQRLDDLQVGARVEINPDKRSPLDFALWKAEKTGTFWQSPWGWGRPGWHIECSALAREYLGDQIDIHGGGADLIFPHHENEIAQSESFTGKTFAGLWLHNAFVQINKEKMSKSLGNFFTLRQLFINTRPMVIRFLMLTHHYRSPIDFSLDDLESIQRGYQKLCHIFASLDWSGEKLTIAQIKNSIVVNEMIQFLLDDFNTVGALGVIFKQTKLLQKNPDELKAVGQFLQDVFGLDLIPLATPETVITSQIQSLIEQRERARFEKNWQKADEIRLQLAELGFVPHDKKS